MRLTWPFLSLVLGACTGTTGDDVSTVESKSTALETAQHETSSCWSTTLSWGDGPSAVGLIPKGYEVVARGPQSLAVGHNDEIFVLDSVNGRVLGVTANETRVVIDELPSDVEDLAVGADGAFAVHSSLQARTWVFDADGAPAGELEVPRSFRSLVGISLGDSREVVLHSAYQESYSLGSPAAPKDLPTMLSQKREGAFALPSGDRAAVKVSDGSAELLLLRSSGDEGRVQISQALPLAGRVSGANLVGTSGDVACLRVEHVTQPAAAIEVHRRAVCVDTATGLTIMDHAMAEPGAYIPRHELAVGGSAPILASLKPTNSGLTVEACEVVR